MEVAKRQTQERELRDLQSGSDMPGGVVAAPACNAVFDESGSFVMFPSWRGIAVGSVATGKVRPQHALCRGRHCLAVTGAPALYHYLRCTHQSNRAEQLSSRCISNSMRAQPSHSNAHVAGPAEQ
jgi:hypothetical protein